MKLPIVFRIQDYFLMQSAHSIKGLIVREWMDLGGKLCLEEEGNNYIIEFVNRATLDRAIPSATEFLDSASRDDWICRNPRCKVLCPVVIEIIGEGGERVVGGTEAGKTRRTLGCTPMSNAACVNNSLVSSFRSFTSLSCLAIWGEKDKDFRILLVSFLASFFRSQVHGIRRALPSVLSFFAGSFKNSHSVQRQSL